VIAIGTLLLQTDWSIDVLREVGSVRFFRLPDHALDGTQAAGGGAGGSPITETGWVPICVSSLPLCGSSPWGAAAIFMLPYRQFRAGYVRLPPRRPYVFYITHGVRSADHASRLCDRPRISALPQTGSSRARVARTAGVFRWRRYQSSAPQNKQDWCHQPLIRGAGRKETDRAHPNLADLPLRLLIVCRRGKAHT